MSVADRSPAELQLPARRLRDERRARAHRRHLRERVRRVRALVLVVVEHDADGGEDAGVRDIRARERVVVHQNHPGQSTRVRERAHVDLVREDQTVDVHAELGERRRRVPAKGEIVARNAHDGCEDQRAGFIVTLRNRPPRPLRVRARGVRDRARHRVEIRRLVPEHEGDPRRSPRVDGGFGAEKERVQVGGVRRGARVFPRRRVRVRVGGGGPRNRARHPGTGRGARTAARRRGGGRMTVRDANRRRGRMQAPGGGGGGADRGRLVPPFACEERARSGGGGAESAGVRGLRGLRGLGAPGGTPARRRFRNRFASRSPRGVFRRARTHPHECGGCGGGGA